MPAKKHYTKADETDEFREFWSIWMPHKRHTDGRGDARDCYFKHIERGTDPQDIIDGARWHIKTLKDPAYIELAASWLNKCTYEDECEQWRGYQAAQEARACASNVTPIRKAQTKTRFQIEWEKRQSGG